MYDLKESVRAGHIKRTQQERIQNTENRRIRCNCERQRHNCCHGEPGRFAHLPRGIANISRDPVQQHFRICRCRVLFPVAPVSKRSSASRRAFSGVPQNILGGVPIPHNSLLVVPANTVIQGHLASNGAPDYAIEWKITSIPVFVFDKASHSGMQNLHLRFTGTMPRAFPFGDVALLNALGFTPRSPI
jgi:hypothetical protein